MIIDIKEFKENFGAESVNRFRTTNRNVTVAEGSQYGNGMGYLSIETFMCRQKEENFWGVVIGDIIVDGYVPKERLAEACEIAIIETQMARDGMTVVYSKETVKRFNNKLGKYGVDFGKLLEKNSYQRDSNENCVYPYNDGDCFEYLDYDEEESE